MLVSPAVEVRVSCNYALRLHRTTNVRLHSHRPDVLREREIILNKKTPETGVSTFQHANLPTLRH